MDEATKKKGLTEQTISRKAFNALAKQIHNDINNKHPIGLINEQFEDLKTARQNLKQLHTQYLVVSMTDSDDENAEDTYLKQ